MKKTVRKRKSTKTITAYCPYERKMVKAGQRGYLMYCRSCKARID